MTQDLWDYILTKGKEVKIGLGQNNKCILLSILSKYSLSGRGENRHISWVKGRTPCAWGHTDPLHQKTPHLAPSSDRPHSTVNQQQASVQLSSGAQPCPTLRPHGLRHARPPCPSPTPGAHSNSCPWSRWCHPAISSSVVPFSSRLQSFPASGSFPMSQLFASGGQSTRVSASASVLPMNIQDWVCSNSGGQLGSAGQFSIRVCPVVAVNWCLGSGSSQRLSHSCICSLD